MTSHGVSLDKFLSHFAELEQKFVECRRSNRMLEVKLDNAYRLIKFYSNKEKSLFEERVNLLTTVTSLQQNLEELSSLKVENQKLKEAVMNLKRSNDKRAEAKVQHLLEEIGREQCKHQKELEALRQQCRTKVEVVERKVFSQMELKDIKMKKIQEEKNNEVEEIRKKLRDQERENQSELLRLQMEFGVSLARVQSSSQILHHRYDSSLLPQSVFQRKLQFIQEEKNKEIVLLRERIKDLEGNQRVPEEE